MKRKIIWTVFILIVLGYTGCSWDYFLSGYIFKQSCKEDVGVFIYEQVELGDEYFIPFPVDKEPRSLDSRFVFGENRLLDKEKFDREYSLEMYKKIPVSEIGPVYLIQTSVTRRSDNKLLSKSVSVRNDMGWLAKLTSFGYAHDQCPEVGAYIHRNNHNSLINNTFILD